MKSINNDLIIIISIIENNLFSFIKIKIEYHFIKKKENGGRPAILNNININIKFKFSLLFKNLIEKFLDILKKLKMKIKEIRVIE